MTRSFERFAGACAVLTALAGMLFTITFASVVRDGDHWAKWASSIALAAGGLLAVPVFVALQALLGRPQAQFAQVGLVLGLAGALGAAVHGAYDVAVLANPVPGNPNLPSQIDPRGVATFAATGAALAVFGALIIRGRQLPRVLGQLSVLAAVLLLVVYFGRLIVLDPHSGAIKPFAVAAGVLVVPAFYLLLGGTLLRRTRAVIVDTPPPAAGSARTTVLEPVSRQVSVRKGRWGVRVWPNAAQGVTRPTPRPTGNADEVPASGETMLGPAGVPLGLPQGQPTRSRGSPCPNRTLSRWPGWRRPTASCRRR